MDETTTETTTETVDARGIMDITDHEIDAALAALDC